MGRNEYPELRAWSRIEPPPALDALVRQRTTAVLERRRAEAAPVGEPSRLAAKGPGYALGMLAYGAQVVDSAARLIWRAVAG